MALSGVYTGARAAYSLRNFSGYTGNVVRLRRSNDNAESDFTGAEIIDGTLLTWTGANSAYVVNLYDQTGNALNYTQGTSASQPRIVNAGVIETLGDIGRPTFYFDGSNDFMTSPSIVNGTTNRSIFLTYKSLSLTFPGGRIFDLTDSPLVDGTAYSFTSEIALRCAVRTYVTTAGTTAHNIAEIHQSGTSIESDVALYLNNSFKARESGGNGTLNTDNSTTQLGKSFTQYGNFYFQEFIVFDSDKTADRAGIYENVRQYYFGDPLLLDENPNAARAYSLRKLRSTYQGPAIRVRVSNNNSEADIGFDAYGNLDLAALASHVGAHNGFIVTWYDQSTAAVNATQSTSGQQARIVNSGTIDTAGTAGRPAVFFDGSNDHYTFTALSSNTDWSSFIVSINNSNDQINSIIANTASATGGAPLTPMLRFDNTNKYVLQKVPNTSANASTRQFTSDTYDATVFNIVEGYAYSGGQKIFFNNSECSLGTPTSVTVGVATFNSINRVSSAYSNCKTSEIILWTSDKTSDRADIYENVRSYYFDTPLGGTNLTTGAPTLTEPILTEGDDYDLEGTNLTTGSPTVTEPVLTQEQALTGTDLSTGSPTVSSPILTEQTNQPLEGSNLTTGSPTITSPVLTEFILPPLPDAVIAFADFTSDLGRQWRVAIHDLENENPPLTTPNMTIRGNGFNLDYESPNDTIHEVIKASKCSTTLVIDPTDSHLISMIQAIALADIGRYYLVIYEDTGEDYGVYWWGPIDTELVKEPDKWPSEVELIATDSLGLMAEKNYNPIGGGLFNGLNTFGQILAKAFERVGNGSAVRGDEDYIKLATNWYNAAMPDTTVDPMLYTAIRQETFWKVSEKESVIQIRPWKVSEVMDAVLNGWNARIIMSKGYYHIEQPDLYANNNINRQIIDSDGAAVSRTSEGVVRNIDQTDLFTTHGGYREWARPLQTSKRVHKHEGSNNVLIPDETYSTPTLFPYSNLPLQTTTVNSQKTLKIRFAIRLKVTNRRSAAFLTPYIGFRAVTYLSSTFSADAAMLWKPTMGSQMQWVSNTNQRYGFFSNPIPNLAQDEQNDQVIVVNFETPSFIGDNFDQNIFQLDFGVNTATAAFKRYYPSLSDYNGFLVIDDVVADWSANPYDSTYDDKFVLQYKVLGAQIIFDDNNSNEIDYEAENGNVESGNTYDCPVVLPFGDVVHHLVEPGALRVWNGTGYEANQNGWGDGNLSGDEAFHYLAANEVAALRYRPQDRQYFDLYGIIDAVDNVNYQGSRYAFIGGSYSARADRWTGYWQRLGKSKVGIIGGGITVNFPPISNITWLWADPNGPNLTLNAAQGLDPTQVGITSAPILADPNVTTIPIVPPNHSGIKAGMTITVKSTTTGVMQEFEVGADVEPTDTSITVVGQELLGDIDAGAQVIVNFSNYVDVLGEIYTGTYEPLKFWEEDRSTSGVNATVHANRWRPKGSATNIDAVIQPKGTGAILAQLPDGTSAGGNKRGANAVDLQRTRATAARVASGGASFIGGGSANMASGDASVVVGGNSNTSSNDYTTVGGGLNNTASGTDATVSGGNGNQATGTADSIGGGLVNTASGTYSTISGGTFNKTSGPASTVGGGGYNEATQQYATIAGGFGAIANKYGMEAYGSANFSAYGDSQREGYMLQRVTTNDTPAILTTNGSSPVATNTIGIASGDVCTFIIMVQGIRTDNKNVSTLHIVGNIQNISGTTSFVELPTPLASTNGISGAVIDIVDNDTNDRLDIEVTGLAATTIRWNAYVTLIRIKT